MSKYKIYGKYTPMFLKTVLGAIEMNLDFDVIPVDLMKGENKKPEHLKLHPFGKVPALEHNGKFIFESNAILRYMANSSKSSLYPVEAYERAVVDQWVDYFSLQAGKWISTIWFEKVINPQYFDTPTNEKIVAENMTMLLEAMPVLENHFSKNTYLAGNNLSLADLNAYCTCFGHKDAKIPLQDFPNFLNWFEKLANRESVKKMWTFDQE